MECAKRGMQLSNAAGKVSPACQSEDSNFRSLRVVMQVVPQQTGTWLPHPPLLPFVVSAFVIEVMPLCIDRDAHCGKVVRRQTMGTRCA